MARSRPTSVSDVTRALRAFLATEIAGGVVLLVATAAALAWANSPAKDSYHELWETVAAIQIGGLDLSLDLRHWVNDGLMALFFLVVGLEVKREFLEGEMRDPRKAALPVLAALGGMLVPALVYLALNPDGDAARGWGIPMATDIAFALGVAALLGPRLPSTLRLFLLTLAIVDDIGAIVVIAVFYSSDLSLGWLTTAVVLLAAVVLLRQLGLTYTPFFVVLGTGVWLATHEAGVHATLAGVAMGLLAPARPMLTREIALNRADELLDVFSPEAARTTARLARLSVSQMEWLQHALHPWTSLAIVPVFALANAGVELSGDRVADAVASPVAIGVAAGLVLGKLAGISLFAWLGCRLGVASLPEAVRWPELVGTAALAGIGFTVALFITGLAFDSEVLAGEAKIGILAASVAASLLGLALLWLSTRDASLPSDPP